MWLTLGMQSTEMVHASYPTKHTRAYAHTRTYLPTYTLSHASLTHIGDAVCRDDPQKLGGGEAFCKIIYALGHEGAGAVPVGKHTVRHNHV